MKENEDKANHMNEFNEFIAPQIYEEARKVTK